MEVQWLFHGLNNTRFGSVEFPPPIYCARDGHTQVQTNNYNVQNYTSHGSLNK